MPHCEGSRPGPPQAAPRSPSLPPLFAHAQSLFEARMNNDSRRFEQLSDSLEMWMERNPDCTTPLRRTYRSTVTD